MLFMKMEKDPVSPVNQGFYMGASSQHYCGMSVSPIVCLTWVSNSIAMSNVVQTKSLNESNVQ